MLSSWCNNATVSLSPAASSTHGCSGWPASWRRRRRAEPADEPFCPGVYRTDEDSELWFVVVSELPRIRETVVLRLLGSRRRRREAFQELLAIPRNDPEWPQVQRFIEVLLQAVLCDNQIPEADKEDVVTQARAEVERIHEETLNRGRREGLKEGLQEGLNEGLRKGEARSLLLIYQHRLGPVPASIQGAVMAIEDPARLEALLPIFLSGTAQEIARALLV
jgi:hypothetical protein